MSRTASTRTAPSVTSKEQEHMSNDKSKKQETAVVAESTVANVAYNGQTFVLVETDVSWVKEHKDALDIIDRDIAALLPDVTANKQERDSFAAKLKESREQHAALAVKAVDICEPIRVLCGYTRGPLPEAYRNAKEAFFAAGLSRTAYDKRAQRVRDEADPSRVADRAKSSKEDKEDKDATAPMFSTPLDAARLTAAGAAFLMAQPDKVTGETLKWARNAHNALGAVLTMVEVELPEPVKQTG